MTMISDDFQKRVKIKIKFSVFCVLSFFTQQILTEKRDTRHLTQLTLTVTNSEVIEALNLASFKSNKIVFFFAIIYDYLTAA